MEGADDLLRQARNYPKKTWDTLRKAGALPTVSAVHEHASRFDGASEAIPNACLKVPTGGGKTLLASAMLCEGRLDFLSLQHDRCAGLACSQRGAQGGGGVAADDQYVRCSRHHTSPKAFPPRNISTDYVGIFYI